MDNRTTTSGNKVAETVYQMLEECYDQPGLNPGLVGASGDTAAPCRNTTMGAYEELRSLWRVGIDAAWFGDASLPETAANSSSHYGPKSRMQAKIDNSQDFFNSFLQEQPRGSQCQPLLVDLRQPSRRRQSHQLRPLPWAQLIHGQHGHVQLRQPVQRCGKHDTNIRQEAIEEAISTTIENSRYFQESWACTRTSS